MKHISFIALGTALFAFWACGSSDKATVNGTLEGVTSGSVIVKALEFNKLNTLDTLALDASGAYSASIPVKAGDPEFVYVYYGSVKIASLILSKGESAKVVSDTLGNYSVSGSPESQILCEADKAQQAFAKSINDIRNRLKVAEPSSKEAAELTKSLYRSYIDYYRQRVIFVMKNSKSLASVPVLMEKVGDTPVFSQQTDALHFRSVADSLALVYPDSRYVKSLEAEAARRENAMLMSGYIENAPEVGFIDVVLPDDKGQKRSLNDIAKEKKVVMVYFWASSMEVQAVFNLDVLKPLYKQYAPKGFEIYAISLDTDKASWASTVKNQASEWVNVCDGLGAASSVVATYNVRSIPSMFFIINGEIVSGTGVKDESTLRSFLSSKL